MNKERIREALTTAIYAQSTKSSLNEASKRRKQATKGQIYRALNSAADNATGEGAAFMADVYRQADIMLDAAGLDATMEQIKQVDKTFRPICGCSFDDGASPCQCGIK